MEERRRAADPAHVDRPRERRVARDRDFDFFKTTPSSSLLGIYDLEGRTFRAVEGPRTSLDRFVQLPGRQTVYTITHTGEPDGRLGILDVEAGIVRDVGAVGRDLSLLPDGRVLLRRGHEPVCITRDLQHCD